MTISPVQVTLTVGKTVQLAASPGAKQWTSSNPAVATVSSGGLVTANAPGTVTIKAQKGNQKATATIVVQAVAPTPEPTPQPLSTSGMSSPEGTEVPPASQIVDGQLKVWALGPPASLTG